MKTPFTTAQFFEVFEKYNAGVFPAQLLLILLGIFSLVLVHGKKRSRHRMLSGFLGFFWLWTGLVYHINYFTSINRAAYVFGGVFILQGVFFLILMFRNRLEFDFRKHVSGYLGYFFILFGLIIYPLISYFAGGSSFSTTISLGLPCPTTIMTFGFLILAKDSLPRYAIIIPILWAFIGTSAAINFGVYQDYVMLLSAIVAGIYIFRKRSVA